MRSNTSLSSVLMCSGMNANMMKFIPKRGINNSVDLASLLQSESNKQTDSGHFIYFICNLKALGGMGMLLKSTVLSQNKITAMMGKN